METAGFSICSVHSDRELWISNWAGDQFTAELRGAGLRATRLVYAYTDARGLLDLLDEIASYERPWAGPRTWNSIEGEFQLAAACSVSGHVLFLIKLRDAFGGVEGWSVSADIASELGLLPAIARTAKLYFSQIG